MYSTYNLTIKSLVQLCFLLSNMHKAKAHSQTWGFGPFHRYDIISVWSPSFPAFQHPLGWKWLVWQLWTIVLRFFFSKKECKFCNGAKVLPFWACRSHLSSDSELTLTNTLTYGKISLKVILPWARDLRSRCPANCHSASVELLACTAANHDFCV